MIVRELLADDIPVIKQIYEDRGLTYRLPDLFAPNIVHAQVVEDGGEIVNVLFGVKTVEMYALMAPDWGTPRKRLLALQIGHESFRNWLSEHGWEDAFAVLPPKFAKAFGKRLHRIFGWNHGTWVHYSRKTQKMAGDR